MGRDKALLGAKGATLAQRVARAVEAAAGSAVLVGNPQRYEALGYSVIPDTYPGEGPLGGILTALAHTSARWNLVTACDMPGLTETFLRALMEVTRRTRADVVIPAGPSGHIEPMCGVWRKSAREALEFAFAAGVRQVAEAACGTPGVRMKVFKTPEVSIFQNVNTPEEWAEHGAE